jgi:sterol desaturase/sphingolipid hydroxylase (fatty acid hydroxylase superfamily)
MEILQQIIDKVGFPLLSIWFLLLFFLESKYQLRRRVQSRIKRIITNTLVGICSYAFLRLAFLPAIVWLAYSNQEVWRIGLNHLYDLHPALEFAIVFLLLDYFNYVWHILLHKLPLLWRFHYVHHTDLDMDVTTAIRFHFGELIGSILFRGAIVVLTGASPLQVLVYEIVFEAATNFHHSNWRLPHAVEKKLGWLVVTPRMHGIHHSIVKKETDSNYSVIFSFWDRLHLTLRLNVFQDEITIGVPAHRDAAELTAWNLLKMPFTKLRPWKLPDGTVPLRGERSSSNEVQF